MSSSCEMENSAMTAAYRAQRFGFENPQKRITDFLSEFINEDEDLESIGLRSLYKRIRKQVVKRNLFALLLVGYYYMYDEDSDYYLYEYENVDGDYIDLSVYSVCEALLENNFQNYDERERLLRNTPNFYIYYQEE